MEKKKQGRPRKYEGEKCTSVWVPERLKDDIHEFVKTKLEDREDDHG